MLVNKTEQAQAVPQNAGRIPDWLSEKFRFWTFVSMILLVFVHGYNLNQRYLQPWTLPEEPMTGTAFIEYFLSNGLFRFRIPMLFLISGFLYARVADRPYRELIKKRARTLLLPYFIWSALMLVILWLFERSEAGRNWVSQSGVAQIDETIRVVHQYGWKEWLGRLVLVPVAYQLWFIRVLFFYNLAFPAIRWLLLRPARRWIFWGFAFLLWLSTMGLWFMEGEGLLFFSIGVWLYLQRGIPGSEGESTSFPMRVSSFYKRLFLIAWLAMTALKTVLAFRGQAWMGDSVYPVITLLHKGVIVVGLLAAWFNLDPLVRYFMNKDWFRKSTRYSFFIYAVHAPLVAVMIDPLLQGLSDWPGRRAILYVAWPLMLVLLAVVLSAFTRYFFPKFHAVLTGDRG